MGQQADAIKISIQKGEGISQAILRQLKNSGLSSKNLSLSAWTQIHDALKDNKSILEKKGESKSSIGDSWEPLSANVKTEVNDTLKIDNSTWEKIKSLAGLKTTQKSQAGTTSAVPLEVKFSGDKNSTVTVTVNGKTYTGSVKPEFTDVDCKEKAMEELKKKLKEDGLENIKYFIEPEAPKAPKQIKPVVKQDNRPYSVKVTYSGNKKSEASVTINGKTIKAQAKILEGNTWTTDYKASALAALKIEVRKAGYTNVAFDAPAKKAVKKQDNRPYSVKVKYSGDKNSEASVTINGKTYTGKAQMYEGNTWTTDYKASALDALKNEVRKAGYTNVTFDAPAKEIKDDTKNKEYIVRITYSGDKDSTASVVINKTRYKASAKMYEGNTWTTDYRKDALIALKQLVEKHGYTNVTYVEPKATT